MRLEQLLRMTIDDRGTQPEFRIAVQGERDGGVHFIVHANGHNSETLDFVAFGNRIVPVNLDEFDIADWYWRTMEPDDSGDTPHDAVSRGMVGKYCVCEIASSFLGPTRYGFIADVPESDEETFLHFATEEVAIAEAKRLAELAAETE